MNIENYFKWPGKIWIFSDLHLGHKNILRFERLEFASIDEHDNFIRNQIYSTVGEGDTFVCLGDLGVRLPNSWQDTIKNLKCAKKVLVMGNHDTSEKSVYEEYFDEVYPGPIFVSPAIILSHEPVPTNGYFLNIHGHLHDSILDDDEHINVSAKVCGYKLLELDSVYERVSKLPTIRARFGKEWYADKYVFNEKKYREDSYTYKDTGHIIPANDVKKGIEAALEKVNPIEKNRFMHYCISANAKKLNFITGQPIEDFLLTGYEEWKKENA